FGHPVIVNGEVFIADGTRVFGFGLQTGERTRSFKPDDSKSDKNAKNPDACCSLTTTDGLLFARFGPPIVRAPESFGAAKGVAESMLVCLSPQLKELWRLAPPEDAKVPAAWEGAPL